MARRSIVAEEEIGRLGSAQRRRCARSTKALTPWQKVQVARHPDRPHCLNYIEQLIERLHAAGRRPRRSATTTPSWAASAASSGEPVALLGQEKGSDTESRLRAQFRHRRVRKATARRCA